MYKFILCSTIVFLTVFNSHKVNAQITDSQTVRINEIKKWYKEVQGFKLTSFNIKKFEDKEPVIGIPDINDTSYRPVYITLKTYQLNNTYQLKILNTVKYEWDEDIYLYYRNKKIFFCLIKGNLEGNLYEARFYCNENEKIIYQLDKEGEYSFQEILSNNKVNTENLNMKIQEVLEIEKYMK